MKKSPDLERNQGFYDKVSVKFGERNGIDVKGACHRYGFVNEF